MSEVLKVLGQVAPLATTETSLYAVPRGGQAVGSTLIVCNRGGVSDTFRVSIAVAAGVTATKDYLYYDVPIIANDTFAATLGISLSTSDVVRVYCGTANLSFSLFGTEIS